MVCIASTHSREAGFCVYLQSSISSRRLPLKTIAPFVKGRSKSTTGGPVFGFGSSSFVSWDALMPLRCRWIRYCRGKKVQASSASTSSATPVLKPTSPPGILPPVSSSNSPRVSPRSTEESRRVKAPGRKRSSQAYPEAAASAAERGPRVSPPAGARTEVLPSSEKNGTPRESSLFPTIGPT